jgi:hypothetical protein
MRTPGFTAERSLFARGRHYATTSAGSTGSRSSSVLPQQGEFDAPGTCCGKHCPSLCFCHHGVGQCMNVTEERTSRRPAMLMAAGRVSMAAIDSCHASEAVDGGVAFVTCPTSLYCGCWATAHDAGCVHCSHAYRS